VSCATYDCAGECGDDNNLCYPTDSTDTGCNSECAFACLSEPPPPECEDDNDCDGSQECVEGRCIIDIGEGPGENPGITCDLPEMVCTSDCSELIQFDPTNNPADPDYDPLLGYIDYPENYETWDNQYRSWLRRDLVMLIQYTAAKVACLTEEWPSSFGNGEPVGLIDMSEEDGSIPGTSDGSPGHPEGTHTNGTDIDIAYYQNGTSDNRARPVCEHQVDGQEAYHCTAPPHLLDPWRTALFIATLNESSHLRVVGCDGRVGPMVVSAITTLCQEGWIDSSACNSVPITYEEEDLGYGWYYFHHHHFHVSYTP